MIPYFPQPVLHVGPIEVHAFGVLVVAAVLIGGWRILRRAHRHGIGAEEMFRFCFCMFAFGMLGAYVGKAVIEHKAGVRSLGGLVGGFLGGILWCRIRHLSLFEGLRRLDIVAY